MKNWQFSSEQIESLGKINHMAEKKSENTSTQATNGRARKHADHAVEGKSTTPRPSVDRTSLDYPAYRYMQESVK